MQDASLVLSDSQEFAATADSETVIDLGAGWAPEPDAAMRLRANVEAVTTGGGETYSLDVQESADGITYTSTGLVLALTAAGLLTKLFSSTKRYVKLVLTLSSVGTEALTLSAWLDAR
jgi:hypothetical protein